MDIEKKDIEQYLSEVMEAVGNDRYRLEIRRKRGGHYDREGKKRLLHRVQKRDGVPFTEEGHRKDYKG